MKNKNVIKDILYFGIPIILSVLLAGLQLLPIPKENEIQLYESFWCHGASGNENIGDSTTEASIFVSYGDIKTILCVGLWTHRLAIAIGLAIISILLTFLALLRDNSDKRWLKIYLQTSMKEFFPDPHGRERCTIFTKGGGLIYTISYLYRVLFICGRQHIKERTFWLHIKRTPNPFKEYFTMFVRANEPYQEGTSTYFNICKTGNESYGIVSYCAFHKMAKCVETQKISDFYRPSASSFRGQTATLNQYLSDCLLSVEQLKCIHQYSNHIYAVPITDLYEQETLAVLVVDIDDSIEKYFDEDVQDRLGYVARVVGTIIRKDY